MLVTLTSLCGILLEKTNSRDAFAWAVQGMGQDYANLVVVIVLLAGTYLMAKGSFRGYLVWLGAYLYLLYAFAIYSFAVHFHFLFLVYVLVLGRSFFTLIGGLMAAIAAPETVSRALRGNPRARLAAAFLLVISLLFSALWLSEIVLNLLADTVPQDLLETQLPVNPMRVLDLASLLPGMIIAAVLLWREQLPGYLMAVPLTSFTATMGLAIILTSVLSAIHGLPVSVPSRVIVGAIIVMSTVFSYLFLREVREGGTNTPASGR